MKLKMKLGSIFTALGVAFSTLPPDATTKQYVIAALLAVGGSLFGWGAANKLERIEDGTKGKP